ncbi:MAG TPA: hypothetical protein VN374_07770 [Desulfitobacteriaceae bacterium]|nr:hypothetical protein [Desulfitobacteriaceae bacterium]
MAGKKKNGWKHIPAVFLGSFVLAAAVGFGSELLIRHTFPILTYILLLLVIGTGVIFDIVGIAATAASEAPHHARAANRVFGAQQAVYLVRNADKVANFTNDIVGDIAGILSGVMVATIILDIIRTYPSLQALEIWLSTGMLALAASLNITGKAMGKSFAIREANHIIGMVGGIIASFEKVTGLNFTQLKKRGGRKNGAARRDS